MNVFLYLIVIIIFIVANASKKEKQAAKKQQPVNRPPTVQQVQKKPASAPQAKATQPTQAEIRKAAEALLSRKTPAQPQVQAKAAPAREPADGFYQGTSFGDEGIDPCHDDLYADRKAAEAPDMQTPAPAVQLQFTPNAVLNGVIMSEVLNHHV